VELDIALRGGWRRGGLHAIYGPPSSGKTYLCFKTIATEHAHNPRARALYMATEGWDASDILWAQRIGVDMDRLYVTKPTHRGECLNIILEMLRGEPPHLIVLDSLAATIPDEAPWRSAQSLSKILLRMRQRETRTTILFTTHTRVRFDQERPVDGADCVGGRTQRFLTATDLHLTPVRSSPEEACLHFEVDKGRDESGSGHFIIDLTTGEPRDAAQVVHYALERGIATETTGGTISCLEQTLQTRANMVQMMGRNPAMKSLAYRMIMESVMGER
jgi:KaiC/GvpD/RAD55 family RecA-like ATPase